MLHTRNERILLRWSLSSWILISPCNRCLATSRQRPVTSFINIHSRLRHSRILRPFTGGNNVSISRTRMWVVTDVQFTQLKSSRVSLNHSEMKLGRRKEDSRDGLLWDRLLEELYLLSEMSSAVSPTVAPTSSLSADQRTVVVGACEYHHQMCSYPYKYCIPRC